MKPCTTHHHACDCRERALRDHLRQIADEMRHVSKRDPWAAVWLGELNRMWVELYGEELPKTPND
jgi:hypothetical protein